MIRCERTTQLLSQRRDGDLTAGEKLQLATHLALCAPCRRFDQQIDHVGALLQAYRHHLDGSAERRHE